MTLCLSVSLVTVEHEKLLNIYAVMHRRRKGGGGVAHYSMCSFKLCPPQSKNLSYAYVMFPWMLHLHDVN